MCVLLLPWDGFLQRGLLCRQQLQPAVHSADCAGLLPAPQSPPALKGTGGTIYVSLRELGDILLYKESAVCVGRVLGLSLTS